MTLTVPLQQVSTAMLPVIKQFSAEVRTRRVLASIEPAGLFKIPAVSLDGLSRMVPGLRENKNRHGVDAQLSKMSFANNYRRLAGDLTLLP